MTETFVAKRLMKKDKSPRSAYKPIVSPGDASLASSKYFGTPWMAAGENWPTRDGQPLLFVLQLSANQLPEEAAKLLPKDALIQLFYNAGGEYPDSDDASEMALARIVDTSGPAQTLVQPTIPGEWPSAQWRPLTIDQVARQTAAFRPGTESAGFLGQEGLRNGPGHGMIGR